MKVDVTKEDEGLYAVACIHCGERVFRFSGNLMDNCGEITLVCPACGGITIVTGNGMIQTG
jgi:rRNA maturation protein Nop10